MSAKESKIEAGYKVFRNSDFPAGHELASLWYSPSTKSDDAKNAAKVLRWNGFRACVVKERSGHIMCGGREYVTHKLVVMYRPAAEVVA